MNQSECLEKQIKFAERVLKHPNTSSADIRRAISLLRFAMPAYLQEEFGLKETDQDVQEVLTFINVDLIKTFFKEDNNE